MDFPRQILKSRTEPADAVNGSSDRFHMHPFCLVSVSQELSGGCLALQEHVKPHQCLVSLHFVFHGGWGAPATKFLSPQREHGLLFRGSEMKMSQKETYRRDPKCDLWPPCDECRTFQASGVQSSPVRAAGATPAGADGLHKTFCLKNEGSQSVSSQSTENV